MRRRRCGSLPGFGEKAPRASIVTGLWQIFAQIFSWFCIFVLFCLWLVGFLDPNEELCNSLYFNVRIKNVVLVMVLKKHIEQAVVASVDETLIVPKHLQNLAS
jgi:uncharacterized membrane protein (DUF373 family)